MHPDRKITTNIQLLRSAVASKRPTPSTLLDGQVAVNTNAAEPGLYFKLSDGTLTKAGPAGYTTTGAAPNSSPSGSAGNGIGEEWFDGRASFAAPVLKLWNGGSWFTASGFAVDDTTGDYSLAKSLTINSLVANGTGEESHITVPSDTTANRPATAAAGMIRFNSSTALFEGYDGTDWDAFVSEGANGTFIDLTATGNTVIGDNCASDTLIITAATTVNCDMVIGANNSTTLGIASLIGTDITPNQTDLRSLGSTGARWLNVHSSIGTFDSLVTTLNDSEVFVGNASNVATGVAISGDATIDNTGAVTIANDAITTAKIIDDAVTTAKILDANVTTAKILDANVTTAKILDANVTGAKIENNVALAGSPTTTTQTSGDNSTKIATTEYVDTATASVGTTYVNITGDTMTGDLNMTANILPTVDSTYDLGSPSQRFANIYTGDLHFNNEGSSGNDIDGTTGNWTLQEGDENMYFINNKTGAKFRVVMESVG